ncbi:MAG: HD domain-containing protein [bacterium]|nr:HD domain-containing protein [bacterium]
MVKNIFVKDLPNLIGKEVEDLFQIRDLQDKSGKEGQPFVELTIADVSGTLTARIFDDVDALRGKIERGRVHRLRMQVYQFANQLGLRVLDVEKVEHYDIRHFLPSSSVNPSKLEEDLKSFIRKINNPQLKTLLKRIFLDDEDFKKKFLLAPAARFYHHNFVGGLAEHTLQIARVAEAISELYDVVDRDLLIAGALLHDIGKVYEMEYTPDIDFTDEGRLFGHLIIGYEIVSKKIHEIEVLNKFPAELRMKILHMILSHHGELQYGSPVRPMFLEAQILHFLDDLDAKADMFRKASDLRSGNNTKWSEFSKPLGRSVFLGELEG